MQTFEIPDGPNRSESERKDASTTLLEDLMPAFANLRTADLQAPKSSDRTTPKPTVEPIPPGSELKLSDLSISEETPLQKAERALAAEEKTEHFEDKTVLTRTGEHPDHKYVLTVDADFNAKFAYADGRNLEIKTNADGSWTINSSGPQDKDNFELRKSADRRTDAFKYKDGREVTISSGRDHSFNSLTASGPDRFDNFVLYKDNQVRYWNPVTTFKDFDGVKGRELADRAFDDDLRITFAKGSATFATVQRILHLRNLEDKKQEQLRPSN